jgi:hypothetical protein
MKSKDHYWWFGPDSVAQLRDHLNSAAPDCRLEVRPDGDDLTLHVVPDGVSSQDSALVTNKSFLCPPICP